MIVILSYFHTRIDTDIFYTFPKTQVDSEISDRLFDAMTQQKEEEFFTNTFRNLKLLNYYFQICSDWARGNREMLMLSIMITPQISPEIEESIASLCKKFVERMRSNKDIFTGFHIKELSKYNEDDKKRIIKSGLLIREWVKDLYWETLEETRKKSEEEKITVLLNDRYIFDNGQETETSGDDDEDYGYITPFPRMPPNSPGPVVGVAKQEKPAENKVDAEFEPYCTHCGAELPKGQAICHVCGKKVI